MTFEDFPSFFNQNGKDSESESEDIYEYFKHLTNIIYTLTRFIENFLTANVRLHIYMQKDYRKRNIRLYDYQLIQYRSLEILLHIDSISGKKYHSVSYFKLKRVKHIKAMVSKDNIFRTISCKTYR